MSQPDSTKPKGAKPPTQMLVRFGRLGQLGWFDHHESRVSKLHSYVVIKTERGLELGQIVGSQAYRGGYFKSTPEQVDEYFFNRTKDYPIGPGGEFVRYATPEDLNEQEHLERNAVGEAKCCQRIADELGLGMKIVEAEHLFGGERIVFYFTSEHRVDFRELVKRLAREYQTRIELRQIGSRDEAKLISDFETCGQQCCCSRFLKILEPVNMRMAKLQKATLDPSKISGHCGRLKCCLRYEDNTYCELKDKLPTRNTPVKTPKGIGRVVDVQILTQLVDVQLDAGNRQAWPLEEIQILRPCDLERMAKEPAEMMQPPIKPQMESAVTEEVMELAETEQEPSALDETGEDVMAGTDQQPPAGRAEQDRRRSNKNRPRRPQAGPQAGSGNAGETGAAASGGQGQSQGQGQQKKRPRNRRRRRKPSGDNSGNAAERTE